VAKTLQVALIAAALCASLPPSSGCTDPLRNEKHPCRGKKCHRDNGYDVVKKRKARLATKAARKK
jgi:hypothetical protein